MSQEEPKRLIKNIDAKPCGCRITEYSDNSKVIAPCVPCGLNAVAESIHIACQNFYSGMRQASQALAAVATTIRSAHNSAALEAAVKHPLRPVP